LRHQFKQGDRKYLTKTAVGFVCYQMRNLEFEIEKVVCVPRCNAEERHDDDNQLRTTPSAERKELENLPFYKNWESQGTPG
jgi:hypothetical protein